MKGAIPRRCGGVIGSCYRHQDASLCVSQDSSALQARCPTSAPPSARLTPKDAEHYIVRCSRDRLHVACASARIAPMSKGIEHYIVRCSCVPLAMLFSLPACVLLYRRICVSTSINVAARAYILHSRVSMPSHQYRELAHRHEPCSCERRGGSLPVGNQTPVCRGEAK